jgi:hypothetical protein
MRFYCKEKTKAEQGYDKKMYPKLVLKKKRQLRILFLFIPIRHLPQISFLQNFQLTCNPHSPMCAHVHPWVDASYSGSFLSQNEFFFLASFIQMHMVINISLNLLIGTRI